MGIAERSRVRVEDYLSDLERAYEDVPVNQRTLTVPSDQYERARREHEDRAVDTYVRIANEAGEVLRVTDGGEPGLPGGVDYPDLKLEREIVARVAAETGVECTIDGLVDVTIAGISNADVPDDPVLYRLVVVFDASYSGGEPTEQAEWYATEADITPAFV